MKSQKKPEVYTITEIAEILRVSEYIVKKYIEEGMLVCIGTGKSARIPKKSLNRLLNSY